MTEIDDRWAELGGLNATGEPLGPEQRCDDGIGWWRQFEKAAIYARSRRDDTVATIGAIHQRYVALNLQRGPLGYPLDDEKPLRSDAAESEFEHGTIVWRRDLGAFDVYGAIHQRWRQLGGTAGFLGFPRSGEEPAARSGGRQNRFEGGLILWHADVGAFEVHGDILRRYEQLGTSASLLGFPISNEEDAPGPFTRRSRFQRGQIRWRVNPAPFSVLAQNTALVTLKYRGNDREEALRAIIKAVRRSGADVVGLSEVFDDDDRERIVKNVGDVYPHVLHGPREGSFVIQNEDGGLLLLSRHPIQRANESIYRVWVGEDGWADKGILHAFIHVPGQGFYDVFLTHAQNPTPTIGSNASAKKALFAQMSHLGRFVRGHRTAWAPGYLMGDLNIDGLVAADYALLADRLGHPIDTWLAAGDGSSGLTFDRDGRAFLDGEPEGKPRHVRGDRLDYVFLWNANDVWPELRSCDVVVSLTPSGRDISDHYGVRCRQRAMRQLDLVPDRRIALMSVTVTLRHVRCLVPTDGPFPVSAGDDEMRFLLRVASPSGGSVKAQTRKIEDFTYGTGVPVEGCRVKLGNPGDITIWVTGTEIDDIVGADVTVGPASLALSEPELYAIGMSAARSQRRLLPFLRAEDDCEYTAEVEIGVDLRTLASPTPSPA